MTLASVRTAALFVLASCGRVAFDPLGSPAGDGAVGTDVVGDGSTVAASNLIAWYWLDDFGSGSGVFDRSGHGHHGSCAISACPVVVPGPRTNGMLFDGVDDHVLVPFAPELNTTTGFTIATWFRLEAPQGFRTAIVSKSYGATYFNSWEIGLEVDRSIGMATDGPVSAHYLATTTQATVGTWQHLVLRWDGATVEILLDGGVILTDPYSDIAWDSQVVNIGADTEFGASSAPFHGSIDDVRIYNRALTNQEIAAIIAE